MASKFAEFLDKNKIDPRRVLSASRKLERLRPEDRAARLKKRQAKKGEAPAAAAGDAKPEKRRSGRPVTLRALEAAKSGKPIAGPAKTRIVRALNQVLSQKKKEAVDLRKLF